MIIMVVATHPDDEVLGCGGVMAKHSAAGDEVHVLVVTRGSEEIYPKVEIEATRLEMKQAHAILGVRSTTFLDFPAPKLDTIPQHQIVDTISKEIKRLQPEVIYLPTGGTSTATTAQCTMRCWWQPARKRVHPSGNCFHMKRYPRLSGRRPCRMRDSSRPCSWISGSFWRRSWKH